MVSSETIIMQANDDATVKSSSSLLALSPEPARISFSADFMDDDSFISISPGSSVDPEDDIDFGDHQDMPKINITADFEFLSGKNSLDGGSTTMLTADELFFEGKLLPCTARQQQVTHAAEKLASIALRPCSEDEKYSTEDGSGPDPKAKPKANNNDEAAAAVLLGRDQQQEPRIWFVDDDPSPRPPKCTVLWKELLRLKKQRGSSTLSPSSSTSSSSSSSSSSSLGDAAAKEEKEKQKSDESGMSTREKHMRRLKRGLERTKSAASIRIRPMVNVPICAHHTGKSNSLPPLFPLRKTKVER